VSGAGVARARAAASAACATTSARASTSRAASGLAEAQPERAELAGGLAVRARLALLAAGGDLGAGVALARRVAAARAVGRRAARDALLLLAHPRRRAVAAAHAVAPAGRVLGPLDAGAVSVTAAVTAR